MTYNDKMSMASSVEVRVPFLDRELAEFVAWNVPPESETERDLCARRPNTFSARPCEMFCRAEVLRQPKAGFAAPVDYWLANDLKEMVDDLLSESQVRQPWVVSSRGSAASLLKSSVSGRQDWSMQIWQLLTLETVDAGISRWRRGIVAERAFLGSTEIRRRRNRMKQVLQHARTGEIYSDRRPSPQLLPGLRAGPDRRIVGLGGYGAGFLRIRQQESSAKSEGASRPGA